MGVELLAQVSSCPNRWYLLLIFWFLCGSSHWRWQYIGVCRLHWAMHNFLTNILLHVLKYTPLKCSAQNPLCFTASAPLTSEKLESTSSVMSKLVSCSNPARSGRVGSCFYSLSVWGPFLLVHCTHDQQCGLFVIVMFRFCSNCENL